ncbi:MAG: energy transducer TonB [Proteobacteria bacterium]|nr:energy transducer TonB [Pseudomonadota bacterium]
MERITIEKDFLFAALVALAIHIGIAFTHMSTSPRPLHFKAKNYGRLNISMVSTRTADAVPEVKKERKIVVKEKKEIIKPDKQISPIQKKEIITEPVPTEKIETREASPSADALSPPPSAPTGKESLETAKVTLAVPRYDENVPPIYPAIARKRGYEGVVLLSAEILIDGRVGELKIKKSSGYNILDRSALKAVKKWKFEPAKRMGYPITMWVEVPVKYVLRDK